MMMNKKRSEQSTELLETMEEVSTFIVFKIIQIEKKLKSQGGRLSDGGDLAPKRRHQLLSVLF